MVDLNSTVLLLQMVGFLILLFTLNIILYKPVMKVVRERKQVIDDMLAQAKELQAKASENESIYNSKLLEAEHEAKSKYNEIITSASKEKESMISEESSKARQQIEKEKKEISDSLDKEMELAKQYSDELSNKIYNQLVA